MIHEDSNPGSIKVVPPYSLLLSIFGSSQKRRENTKKSKIYSKEKKINSSEKRMPERQENDQKLVEEVKKYKD
jgi:hypothetical protein